MQVKRIEEYQDLFLPLNIVEARYRKMKGNKHVSLINKVDVCTWEDESIDDCPFEPTEYPVYEPTPKYTLSPSPKPFDLFEGFK